VAGISSGLIFPARSEAGFGIDFFRIIWQN